MKTTFLMIPLFALGVAGATTKNLINAPAKVNSFTATASNLQSDPLMESMDKMMKEMHVQPMKGNTDLDFAAMLQLHHKGAIEMSKIELQQGKDAMMKKMAQEIITKQTKEIQHLSTLISSLQSAPKNYDPANKKSGAGKAMEDNMMSMMKMGKMSMSSPDHEFADMMSKHHKDGITMSKSILTYCKNTKLRSMAQMGIAEQTKDIQQMQQWMKSHK
jgi:uncharacterized protein (DUF305 family)